MKIQFPVTGLGIFTERGCIIMVSFGVIEKELLDSPDFQVIRSHLKNDRDINLYGFSPLSLASTLRDHWLYLVDSREDLKKIAGHTKCALLWLGNEPAEPPEGILWLRCQSCGTDRPLFWIHDFLTELFARYQQWEEDLDRCVRDEDFQTMLDLSVPHFRATISLFDSEYHWLGISGPEYGFYLENNRQLPADFIRAVMEDRKEQEVHRHRDAFVAPDPENYFNTQALCYNLFLQDLYWGRVVVMDREENREFLPGDYWILNRLGQRMQTLLRQIAGDFWTPRQGGVSGLCRLIHPLLNREAVAPETIAEAMVSAGWQPDDGCFVGHLILDQNQAPASARAFYCRYVMQEAPCVIAAEVGNHILLLIPRSFYPEISVFLSGFVLILRENNFRLGLSNLCTDLIQLPDYYCQAEVAFAVGSRRKSHYWYHIFSDYALDCLLLAPGRIPTPCFCSEKLRALVVYDQENDTEYVKTLSAYIRCQLNAVQTARELYIHHATMVFRLKRLKEIMGADLKDMDQIVELYLSLRILELERSGML